ncbi:hypothetical protein DH2020_039287 [Rehmannia glutinosa]|uniref:Ubiquitin-like protease family profile domain-containing protein n=1 Tax=Rehmannia glutinosa TaxID=99300 RepID=A0ABR0UW89_REHGL
MSSEEEEREVGSGEEESSEDEQPKKRQKIDQDYPGTQIRAKPKVIVDALAALKPAQKSAVIEMGFGSLFSLKIDDFNKKLTYWLVENFNALSSELVFKDGRRIHLEREDVGRVLGFPDGDIVIEKKIKSGKCALYDEWKTMFPNFRKVTAGDLAVRMMQCVDGGDWFRRHFVTLVDSVFYLDRVSVLGRDVPRTLPAFASWTMEKVKRRIRKEFLHGGFGQGYVEAPYVGVVPLQPRLEGLVVDQGKQSFLPGSSSAGGGGQGYIAKIKSRIACFASDVVEIISLIRDAPPEVTEAPEFSEIGVLAKNLICYKTVHVEGTRGGDDVVGSESQQAEAFWSNPENIAAREDGSDYMDEAIFKAGDMIITREDFVTMRPGTYLSISLIDAWTKILNAKELLRSKSSPFRFFATTYSTRQLMIVDPFDLFCQSLDTEIGDAIPKKLQAYEMFFFPICKSEHLFIIVFDMKRSCMQILDNSSVGGTKCDKYEDVPANLGRFFAQYLMSTGCEHMGQEILQLSPSRISMPWRDAKNKVYCGISAMRHMETYMGGGLRGWSPGLQKGNASLMCTFRSKYTAAIFLDDMNELRDKNLAECKKH